MTWRGDGTRGALLRLATTLEQVNPESSVYVTIDGLTCAQIAFCIREAETNERMSMIEQSDEPLKLLREAEKLVEEAKRLNGRSLNLAVLGLIGCGFALAALIAVAVLA